MSLRSNHQFQIAQRLREARENNGLSQAGVAEKLRRTQSYVSRCETGHRRLDIIELEEFCNLYNIPLSYFIGS